MNARWVWSCLALTLASFVIAGCGSSNSSNVTLTISPTSATVLLGTSVQFIPSETGSTNAITWSVNGIANGNATVGTISSTGLYTAPATVPVQASPVPVPIIFAAANTSLPNSGTIGSVIELKGGFDFTNYGAGNTINISGNSQAGWNGSFIIQASAALPNGNFGVQIVTPAGPPANGTGGTATATPNITITAQVQSTNAAASATITLDSGVRVSVNQPSCSIGTNETFTFTASVSGAPSGKQGVTWTLSGIGSIDPNSGLYTAPSTTGTATVTATSVSDPTRTASATITVVTAADPTISSASPPNGALGAAFLNVYLSGTNFICTTGVLVNNLPLPSGSIFALSSTSLLVQVPDAVLSSTLPTPPASSVTLTFNVQRQNGVAQPCSPSPCQVSLSAVRPAIVSVTPDSVSSINSPPVILDGGYFGTKNTTVGFNGNPVVNVLFDGAQVPSFSFNSDRQLQFSAPAGLSPGLHPITVTNTLTCPTLGAPGCGTGSPNGAVAAINLAVQSTATPTPVASSPKAVGTTPTSVAINTATGFAVVANKGSNDITILSVGAPASPSLTVTIPSLCTGLIGAPPGAACVSSGPTSVAVDNLRNLALVANNTSATLAVVDLGGVHCSPAGTPCVTALLSFPSADPAGKASSFPLEPVAVGINPVSGKALVAFTTGVSGTNGSSAGAILDMNQLQMTTGSVTLPPAVIGSVNLNNGINPHIAVSSRLNWAIATPGGAGSLAIVDLGRQTTNAISSVSCSSNLVTVGTATIPSLQAGQPVLITGVANPSFDGIFSTSAVSNTGFTFEKLGCSGSSTGGTVAYANPVASVATNLNVRGVSINDETQKALLVDPTNTVPAFVFNILDQTSSAVNSLPQTVQNVATAMNPLTNVGVVVNSSANVGYLVNPVSPSAFGTFITGTTPVDVAVDPAANTALVVNQGDNTVSLFSLGTGAAALRSAPAIIQSSFAPPGTTQTASGVTISSSLASPAALADKTMTLIGNFPGTPVPRLDASTAPFSGVSVSNGGRVLTATLSGTTIAGSGPRHYDLDVNDTSGSTFSNAGRLQVIQAVNLRGCTNPAPQGVAIDAVRNVALVTEPGTSSQPCDNVAMVNLATGTGFGANPELAVGANSNASPQGVAVYPQGGLAVVANPGNNEVSIVDVGNDDVATTFSTDPLPDGVAIDLGLGKAVVTANGASVVDFFPVSTTAQTPTTIGVQRGPSGVAIDQINHIAVVANSTTNNASILDLNSSTNTNTSGSISFPQGVAFDPVSDNFLITSSANNQVVALNPNSVSSSAIRVGIDPSSIAYNFESGTLVTANNLSQTITVIDFINQTVRGVFSLPSSTQFAVDIHPQTNLAVVADPVDNQLLLVPLPY